MSCPRWRGVWLFVLAGTMLLSPKAPSHAAQITLAWDPNPESSVTGYKVHTGTSTGNHQSHLDVGNHTTHSVQNLEEGTTYYFAVTAYNSSGKEGDFSEEVMYEIPPADRDGDDLPDRPSRVGGIARRIWYVFFKRRQKSSSTHNEQIPC